MKYWLDMNGDGTKYIVLANITGEDDGWFDHSVPLDTLEEVEEFAKRYDIEIPNINDYKKGVKNG